jgi:hypothetical protein
MVGLTNPHLQEGHREAQGGRLLGEIGAWGSGWVAFECGCRARLVFFEAESVARPPRRLLECGVCGKGFARSGSREAPREGHGAAVCATGQLVAKANE